MIMTKHVQIVKLHETGGCTPFSPFQQVAFCTDSRDKRGEIRGISTGERIHIHVENHRYPYSRHIKRCAYNPRWRAELYIQQGCSGQEGSDLPADVKLACKCLLFRQHCHHLHLQRKDSTASSLFLLQFKRYIHLLFFPKHGQKFHLRRARVATKCWRKLFIVIYSRTTSVWRWYNKRARVN